MIAETLHALVQAGLDPDAVLDVVSRALDEDPGAGPDVAAAATIPLTTLGLAEITAREPGVVAGLPVAALAFEQVGEGRLRVDTLVDDGDAVTAGAVLARVHGPVRDILTAEHTALNLLGRLCGVATLTREWVQAVAGTGTAVRATRRAVPGLRILIEHAVRCGGGEPANRSPDAAVLTDHHVSAAGSMRRALELVRAAAPNVPVLVEAADPDRVRAAIDLGADLALLLDPTDAGAADAVRHARDRTTLVGAGGRLGTGRAAALAATGIDVLAVAALTESAPMLAVGLDLREHV